MKKLFSILLALALSLSLTVTAFAYSEYGLLYDATDLLDPETAQTAENLLEALTDDLAVEFRVDVVADLEGEEIYDYAALFYEKYEYGYGEGKDGVLLMLHLVPDESGLAFKGVQLYCGGTNRDMLWGFADALDTYAGSYLTDAAWNGALEEDNATFAALIDAYTNAIIVYFSDDIALEPGAPVNGNTGTAQAPSADKDAAAMLSTSHSYIADAADLLSSSELADLEARAQELSARYGCGVYVITVEDYRPFGYSPEDACRNIHDNYGLSDEAIVLLLSMDDRDYDLTDFGKYLETGLTAYGRDTLRDSFLDNFKKDDWYGGFSDYYAQSAVLLEAAANNTPLDKTMRERAPKAYGIALAVGLVSALITCSVFKAQMKTAVKATSAEEYIAPMGVDMRVREDRYTHTTETRRRIEKSSGSGGGGGGGRSRSGKF